MLLFVGPLFIVWDPKILLGASRWDLFAAGRMIDQRGGRPLYASSMPPSWSMPARQDGWRGGRLRGGFGKWSEGPQSRIQTNSPPAMPNSVKKRDMQWAGAWIAREFEPCSTAKPDD